MNSFLTYLICLIGLCPAPATNTDANVIKSEPVMELTHIEPYSIEKTNIASNYLAGQFAQQHHDWERAAEYMENVRLVSPESLQLLSRSMILYMGSGQAEKAVAIAKDVIKANEDNALALLLLTTQAFHEKNYEQAGALIEKMPAAGSLSEFMVPLLASWSKAGTGEYDIAALNKNTIHIYHAVLIADFLNKDSEIEKLLTASMTAQGMTIEDVERTADVYAYLNKTDLALELYKKAYEEWPGSLTIPKKIEALAHGQETQAFQPVKTPEEGVANALYEMAVLLFREQSDDSARIFAHMALFLDPNLTNTALLLAHIAARNERYNEAIAYYRSIRPENDQYLEARRQVASLLEDTDRIEEALTELESLFRDYKDLDSLIQIGDIYRRSESFEKAIEAYNRAEDILGTIPKEYWHLYYVRGMSYEQNGQWEKAEQDLETALTFQPDHPLVMNYLGYAWADQGVNLKQSLELIRKAAALQNSDGYIIDSLGWVLYRTGQYEEAIPELERAVELLPYDPVINDHLGDAYWQVGRYMEARFQWIRAKNHSEDAKLSASITQKLESGLQAVNFVKEARSETDADIVSH